MKCHFLSADLNGCLAGNTALINADYIFRIKEPPPSVPRTDNEFGRARDWKGHSGQGDGNEVADVRVLGKRTRL